jgi:tetratricopeptide (TPR) repeat protein
LKNILITLITVFNAFQLNAQNNKVLSPADSITLKRYYDTISTCQIYGPKRQRYLDSALMLNHNNAYLWQQKAMPLYKMKKYEIGERFLDSAVKYDKTLYYKEYSGFMKCIFHKSYKNAIQDLMAVKTNNENGFVMDHSFNFYIGLSYLQLNNLDSANFYIKKSLDYGEKKIGEGHFLEYFYFGIVKMEQEDYNNAMLNFDKAIKIYSNFADAKYYKGICLQHQKKYKEAFDLYKESLKNLKEGYTINEDNVFYEDYPYQIKINYLKVIVKD